MVAALAAMLVLGGCGKKPDFPIAPQGRAADQFPHVYPNPAFDPNLRSAPKPAPETAPAEPPPEDPTSPTAPGTQP